MVLTGVTGSSTLYIVRIIKSFYIESKNWLVVSFRLIVFLIRRIIFNNMSEDTQSLHSIQIMKWENWHTLSGMQPLLPSWTWTHLCLSWIYWRTVWWIGDRWMMQLHTRSEVLGSGSALGLRAGRHGWTDVDGWKFFFCGLLISNYLETRSWACLACLPLVAHVHLVLPSLSTRYFQSIETDLSRATQCDWALDNGCYPYGMQCRLVMQLHNTLPNMVIFVGMLLDKC